MSAAAPVVDKGRVIAQRLYDLAYAIDLERACELCAELPRIAPPPGPPTFGTPPLRLRLAPVEIGVDGAPRSCEVSAHLYDFGVLSLALTFAAQELAWDAFARFLRAVELAVSADGPAAPWSGLLQSMQSRLAPALERPGTAVIQEDYQLVVVDAFREAPAGPLQDAVDLVPLLAADPRPLSADARDTLLRHRFAYLADDCVVVGRDRAFLYQPAGDAGVAAVLEAANAQLLELRYYDALLDAELPRMYGLVARTRSLSALSAPGQLARLARRLYTLVAEVTELTGKVDNALRIAGHPYLARVYGTTLELFDVPALAADVDRKLAIIRDTYAALYNEAAVSRAGLLELTIIVLIAVELLLPLFRR